jgi:hypothetical protein
VRRIAATLLVVASPVVLAVPAGAQAPRPAGVTAAPAIPPASQAVSGVVTATPAPPATVAAPTPVALPSAPALRARPPVAVVRPAAKALRATTRAVRAADDAAYAARLQAELCLARQIFCGLTQNGRYPTG